MPGFHITRSRHYTAIVYAPTLEEALEEAEAHPADHGWEWYETEYSAEDNDPEPDEDDDAD